MRLIDADALIEEISMLVLDHVCLFEQYKADIGDKIKNAPTIMQWVSVEDELPDVGASTLFLVSGKYAHTGFLSHHGDFKPYEYELSYSHESDVYAEPEKMTNVTHWMPLPEPPTE